MAGFGGLAAPTSLEDLVSLTVGEYLDLLAAAEQALLDNRPLIQSLLSNPEFTAGLDAEELAFFRDWSNGNVGFINDAFAEIRAILDGVPRSTLLINVEGLDGSGGTLEDDLTTAFDLAQTRLADLLWNQTDGLFTSPIFTIDADSGNWFIPGADASQFSGSTLINLWSIVGEAAGNAILSYFETQFSLLEQFATDGVTVATCAQAEAAVEVATVTPSVALQGFGQALTGATDVDLSAFESLAATQFQAIISAITDLLPAATSALDTLIVGSRNSDPSFVVALDGAVSGSDDGDWFYLNDLANVFDGGLGQDILFGFGGNDRFTGGADDDTLFGGAGAGDTAVYSGLQGRYSLQISGDGVTVVDRSGIDGTDRLSDIEVLSFAGGEDFNLRDQIGIASLSAEEIDSFVELYIAYFNRAPDAEGLNFWGSAFANGVSLEEITRLFLTQPETENAYPDTLSTLEFVTQVYGNVLGRTPDQGGLNFWINALEGEFVTRDAFILNALEGVKIDLGAGATQEDIDLQLADRAYLSDKTDIGTYFAVIRGLSDLPDANAVMDLVVRGDQGSIDTAFEAINAIYADALDADTGAFLIQLVGIVDDPFTI
ncbi:DUF4214 domain-containing protein [Marivita sp.]|uniref:DUF4214 domain-containing protein n=1 Tax=Marivita sp. TaxID=2003365 RepID=UPI003F4A88B4